MRYLFGSVEVQLHFTPPFFVPGFVFCFNDRGDNSITCYNQNAENNTFVGTQLTFIKGSKITISLEH